MKKQEPEVVVDVEVLISFGFTLTHRMGFGTSLLQRGWTLVHSGVENSKRLWGGWQFLLPPRLSVCTLEFTDECRRADERVASLYLWVEGMILNIVCAYGP